MPRALAARMICDGDLAHLADRARRAGQLGRVQRLHRVDHADLGALGVDRREHGLEVGLGEHRHVERARAQALRAQADLRRGLLAGDVERAPAGGLQVARAPCSSASTCRSRASRRAGRASPGTSPPPSTRSSSPIPVCSRATLRRPTSAARTGAAAARARRAPPPPPRPPPARGAPPRRACSTRRTRALPVPSGLAWPQAAQTWMVVERAMASAESRCRGGRVRPVRRQRPAPAPRRRAGPSVSSIPREKRMKPSATSSVPQRARRSAVVWMPPKLVASMHQLAARRGSAAARSALARA